MTSQIAKKYARDVMHGARIAERLHGLRRRRRLLKLHGAAHAAGHLLGLLLEGKELKALRHDLVSAPLGAKLGVVGKVDGGVGGDGVGACC